MSKTAIVMGAGGFIGSHLVKRLKQEGYFVRGVDLKYPEFSETKADEFLIADLRDPIRVDTVLSTRGLLRNKAGHPFDELYQLAADMGGAGYVFTGDNDAKIMRDSMLINVNAATYASLHKVKKVFFSSSACVYPWTNQDDITVDPITAESSAYPANPDSEYGWEKLIAERLYKAYERTGLFKICIARFHNIYGPEGTFEGGREKVPAALCRKVIESEFEKTNTIEIWGTGEQKRSFLYIDDCLDRVRRLMFTGENNPVNIGSDEIISINDLGRMIIDISGRKLKIKNIKRGMPIGVQTRSSDNAYIKTIFDLPPVNILHRGIRKTYAWIRDYIDNRKYIYERNPDTDKIRRKPV
ncbi:MAG TPA: NAD-dependent epimerase/dehydratase family protein [bacterium]|nr:NAD-dependent epimerase/dehydratase family protein [bacterium]